MNYLVGFIVYPGFQLQHIAGPLATFESVGGFAATPYHAHFLSETGGIVISSAGIRIETQAFADAARMDILFVSGGFASVEAERSQAVAHLLQSQAPHCRHIAAVSSGTIVLAASGLLDGRRAATHWSLNKELAERYPLIRVESDMFIVRDGAYWTTSAIIGGIEIARRIIREDIGKIAANRATHDLLNQYYRHGDIDEAGELAAQRFRALIGWARERLGEPLSVEQLAEQAQMHPRHFVPAFAAAMGQTPAKAIERIRLEAAFLLVDRSELSIGTIADEVGFKNPERMRRAFIRAFGQPPQEMRVALRQRRPDR